MSEKRISTKKIYGGKVLSLRVDEIVTDRGVKGEREIVSHHGGAAVLAVKGDKILLERQFRYAYGEELWEIPAGKRDGDEAFEETARRELEEETGNIPLNLKKILTLYPSPGYTDEVIEIFYADKFEKGEVHFDDTEFVVAEWFSSAEVYNMVYDGRIKDAKTLAGVLWFLAKH